MKNYINISLLIITILFAIQINAQQDNKSENENNEDTFTYKKIDITSTKKDKLPLTGGDNYVTNGKTASNKNISSGIGETPGNLSVSLTGGAQYTVPIIVPKGINGVSPDIALVYDSQIGNGNAGFGWDISGISSITRIPSTTYHDGVHDGVDFDEYDRFALDGVRLILKSGTYGSDGATYETESYSNLKIVSYGVSPFGASYGPEYFKVFFPDGAIATYGGTSSANSLLAYSIAHWQNAQSISIDYAYTTDINVNYIRSISYGGTSIANHPYEIDFNFNFNTSRKRYEVSFVNNIKFQKRSILSDISVKSSGNRLKRYDLQYEYVNNYNRLTQIQEFGENQSIFHTPIEFSYSNSDQDIEVNDITTTLTVQNIEQRNAETVALDLTGNGKMDFLVYPKDNKNKFWAFTNIQEGSLNQAWEINTGSFETLFPTKALSFQNKVLPSQGVTVVKNGPNDDVYFRVYKKAAPSAGGVPLAFDYTKTWNAPTYSYHNSPTSITQRKIPMQYISGDFNGDGLTDVIAIGKSYTSRYCQAYECANTGQQPIGEIDDSLSEPGTNNTEPVISPEDPFPGTRPPNNGSGSTSICYSCNNYNSTNRSVYFIDLNRNNSLGSGDFTGVLAQALQTNDRLEVIDFNGDGKSDIIQISDNKLFVYGLNHNNDLEILWEDHFTGFNGQLPLYFGDYNGDGKTDFLRPLADNSFDFKFHLSTGTRFGELTKTLPFKYLNPRWDNGSARLDLFNLIPLDINGDGKTDIVEYNTSTYNEFEQPWITTPEGVQTLKVHYNRGVYGSTNALSVAFTSGGTISKTGNLEHYPIPIFLTSNEPNKSLDFASISNQWVTSFTFNSDIRQDMLLKSINNNGVTYNIDYNYLDNEEVNDIGIPHYYAYLDSNYPDVDINRAIGSLVVTKLERVVDNCQTLYQRYAYENAIFNYEGRGFLGFTGMAVSNWHTTSSDRVYNIRKFDTQLRGAVTHEYTMPNFYSFNVPSAGYISKTEFQNNYSLSSSKVLKWWVESSLTQNSLYGTHTNITYSHNDFNLLESVNTNYSGDGSRYVSFEYDNNLSETNYYIGRITKKTVNNTVGSESFSTEQRYLYSSNLVNEIQTKANNAPWDRQSFTYDNYGNVTSVTVSPNGETPRTTSMNYDSSGLFLEKVIDQEGLETRYNYNTVLSTLSSTKNPYGHTTSYEYDEWYRVIKETDYLNKETHTSYSESFNNFYTINSISDYEAEASSLYDPLKRVVSSTMKNVNGNYIKTLVEYDKFDRPYKTSQPLDDNANGSSAQWNETEYDFYGRPIKQTLYTGRVINISYSGLTTTVDDGVKTVSSTVDGLGNVVSVTDPGGTINYTYFGNGNLKSSNYNGVVIEIEQDDWGRKTKLTDPSAGVYEYEYNGFNEITKEITPKGTTEYSYSDTGKLLEEHTSGDNTDMTVNYTYHPTYKLQASVISLTDSNGNNSSYNFTYDNTYGYLLKVIENNPFATFSKDIEYDEFGRPETETSSATLFANNSTISKKTKNQYQNGYLKAIRDFDTNSNIWEVNQVNIRGQVTEATYGNNIKNQNSYDNYGYLTSNAVLKTVGGNTSTLMQLSTDFNVERGTLNSRTNSMFSWSETFDYDDLDRLIKFNDNNGDNLHEYDDSGRITTNNTIGDYNYSGTSYQVANIDLNTQGDLYYQQHQLQQVNYNAFKKPFDIHEEGKEKIGFQYNAFKGRSNMFYGNEEDDIQDRNQRKHYSFDGSIEISYNTDTDETTFVNYIGGDAYSAPAIWRSKQVSGTNEEGYYYLHRDYLGSIMLITNNQGDAEEKRHFDAWGNIVKVEDGNGNVLDKLTFLDRGYTGHEHLQGVSLIHMNGRLYDSKLKRFLSPDNFIQDVTNTQNYNRYGYVFNNPLMYVDPSGETTEDPGLSGAEQTGLGALIASAGTFIENNWGDIKGAQIGRWFNTNANSIGEGIARPFREVGRWIKRIFGKRNKTRILEPQGTIFQDPLATAFTGTSVEALSGGGGQSSLGIIKNTIVDYYSSLGNGFVSAFTDTGSAISDFVSDPFGTIAQAASNHWNKITSVRGWMHMANEALSKTNPFHQEIMDLGMALHSDNFASTIGEIKGRQLGDKVIEGASIYAGGVFGRGLRSLYKSLPRIKPHKASGGKINGLTISKGTGYGAKPRFDIHPLRHPSTRSKWFTLPRFLTNGKIPIPHYHRRGPGGIRRHRPWEVSPGDNSWWSRF